MFLKNCKIWLGQYDITADFNQIALNQDVDPVDDTRFGPVLAKAVVAGLHSAKASGKCFWAANSPTLAVDDILAASLALSGQPLSVGNSNAGALGELAYTLYARSASLQRSGQVGQQFVADVNAQSHGSPLVHGIVLANTTQTGNGSATGQLLGLLASGKTAYAALHIVALSGGTLTVRVQSDDGVGFASPTDRLTFAAATGPGAQWLTLAGPVATDTYWRANWTLTGGSATFALILGFA